MIVFRPREEAADPRTLVSRLREKVTHPSPADHDKVCDWLIEAGVLESALADALRPGADGDSPALLAAAQPTLLAAEALIASWKNEPVRGIAARLERALAALSKHALPETVVTRVPEGYAFHGLYPETYLAAAETFAREKRPAHVVVIGLRSIGTSLSAVVAAALARSRCRVLRRVIRPRGTPQERLVALDRDLAEIFASRRHAWFLVVDEGPGLTGSSMAAAAKTLERLGAARERIVLLPSWKPDPAIFELPPVRECWASHPAYTGSFDEQWVESGRLSRALGLEGMTPVNGARTLPLLYRDGRRPEASSVPRRRKFAGVHDGEPVLAGFIGLGGCGHVKQRRAERIAEANLTPEILSCASGFLATRFLPGTPVVEPAGPELLSALARYLAFVRSELQVEGGTPFAEIVEMTRANVTEGIGESWAEKAGDRLSELEGAITPVRTEGRMMPEDWRHTPDGWMKSDAGNDHEEQDFPGCTDIAWDVASASEEFGLSPAAEGELIAQVRRLTGDRGIGRRVAPFRVAYLAYRLGHAHVCARAVPAAEAPIWEAEVARQRVRLERAIDSLAS